MAEGYKSYRIRTKVGQDAPNVVNVHLDQTYDEFQILSLKIDQKNSYNLYQSDKGIVVGRVLANGGVGVSNAKVSIFIPTDDTMGLKKSIIYPYSSVNDINDDRVRYNLLPDYLDEECHQNVGTFPNKRLVLDNNDIIEVFDKFWKYTTVTNTSGDYMLYGIPTGNQTLHMDVDLSDIGLLSQRPTDLVYKGFNINQFESPTKFKKDTNLNSLSQIKSQDVGVFVYPFWGDSTDNPDNIAVTRCDIQIDYKFEPTCVFIGSIITDTGSNAIGKNCAGTDNVGKMSDLVAGEGSIEMIRKTIDNKVEEFQIKGNRVIDGDGVWCYQIPMNLDYVMTDEFGNLVPTDNPEKGIPTRARVRFRISLDDSPSDDSARKRCKYLVPNNPRLDSERYPVFTADEMHEPDYEFGTNTRDESYCDLFWNKVYTVKNYIPRIQKNTKVTNRKHTGIKLINHYGDNNPMPYNNLSIKLSFTYRFICVLTKIFILLVGFLNNLLSIIGAIPCKIAEFFREVASFFRDMRIYIRAFGKTLIDICLGCPIAAIFDAVASVFETLTPSCIAISSEFCTGDVTHAYTFYPGCGRKGIAAVIGPLADCVWEKTQDRHYEDMAKLENQEDKTEPINNDAELYNCVESQLAEDNDATSFNFQNDWINGTLYSPLWFRKITKKKSFLFGLFKRRAKDEWCSADHFYDGLVRLYHPCSVKRDGEISYHNHDGVDRTAFFMGNKPECDDDCQEKKTPIGLNYGLIRTKQTMLGQTVYYYKPVEFEKNKDNTSGIEDFVFNTANTPTVNDYYLDKNGKEVFIDGTLKLLFATDIVLLGSLNDCDLNGVPQFFKSLESTTYKLPPNMLFTDNNMVQNFNEDGTISTHFDQVSTSEMTGNDWGNSNDDICGVPDGGLFYDIGCSSIEMIPKSCINLLRICEFGVSLDETKQIPDLNDLEAGGDNAFQTLVPDGFISKDELYNDDERSMFATMNGNELKTKLNLDNGLKEYDFRHLYVDNFDKSLFSAMQSRQKKCSEYTYKYNYNLEDFSPDYYDFRMGKNPFFYDEDKKFPRYENSFYFYFGLKVGKTAIDKFNSQFFAECHNPEDAVSPVGIETKGNTWCSELEVGTDGQYMYDGYVKIDLSNVALPCDILIQDNNSPNEFNINDNNDEKIIIARSETISGLGDKIGDYVQKCDNSICALKNGSYTMVITDADGEIITVDFDLSAPYLSYSALPTNFKQSENVLLAAFTIPNTNTRENIAKDNVNAGQGTFKYTRKIGGTIAIGDIVDGFKGEPLKSFQIDIVSVNDIEGLGENDTDKKFTLTIQIINNTIVLPSIYWVNSDNRNPFIIGVPKGDERYKITITEICDDKLSNNIYTQIVYVGDMTPYKLYINDIIDYDVIKRWDSGYKLKNEPNEAENKVDLYNDRNSTTNDKYNEKTYFCKNKFSKNWLHISDFDGKDDKNNELPRYQWDELISYQKALKNINKAIKEGHYTDGFELNTKADFKSKIYGLADNDSLVKEKMVIDSDGIEDKIPYIDGVLTNDIIIGKSDGVKMSLIDYFEAFKKTLTGNTIEEQDLINISETIIEECNTILGIKSEFIVEMKNAFWLTCPNETKEITFRAVTDDMPVAFYIAHRSEMTGDDGYNNILEFDETGKLTYSFNEENKIEDITIPSLTIKSSEKYGIDVLNLTPDKKEQYIIENEVSLALDNSSGYDISKRQKYAFFVGVINSSEQKIVTIDDVEEVIPNGKTIPDGINDNGRYALTEKLFGFHVIDKILSINHVSWAVMNNIPYFKPEKIDKIGTTVKMNGLFAGKIYNGVVDFEEAKVGRLKMNIVTLNGEDDMPTKRYIAGSTNAKESDFSFTDYSVNDSGIMNVTVPLSYKNVNTNEIIEASVYKTLTKEEKENYLVETSTPMQYLPLLSSSSTMTIEDASHCVITEEIYGGMTIGLEDDSINNCRDKDESILHISCSGCRSNDVVYFAYSAYSNGNINYPLNFADERGSDGYNKMTKTLSATDKFENNNDGYKMFAYSTDEEALISTATNLLITEIKNNSDEEITVCEYFNLEEDRNYNIKSIGTTGEFRGGIRSITQVSVLLGDFYIVAKTKNNCRAISPVYSFVEVIGSIVIGIVHSKVEKTAESEDSTQDSSQTAYELLDSKVVGFYITNATELYYFNYFDYELTGTCELDPIHIVTDTATVSAALNSTEMNALFTNVDDETFDIIKQYYKKTNARNDLLRRSSLASSSEIIVKDVTGLRHNACISVAEDDMYEGEWYSVVYRPNGGYWANAAKPEDESNTENKTKFVSKNTVSYGVCDFFGTPLPTKEMEDKNYYFAGWYEIEDKLNLLKCDVDVITNDKPKIFVAKWLGPASITWLADSDNRGHFANGQTEIKQDLTEAQVWTPVACPLGVPVNDQGWQFDGWLCYSECDENVIISEDGLKVTTDHSCSVIPNWIKTVQLTYNVAANGGKWNDTDTNEDYTIPVQRNNDYTCSRTVVKAENAETFDFLGWNTSASATTGNMSVHVGNEGLVVYAIFKQKEHIIWYADVENEGYFEDNDNPSVITYMSSSELGTEQTCPSGTPKNRKDWVFNSWECFESCQNVTISEDGLKVTTDHTCSVKPVWDKKWHVKFNVSDVGAKWQEDGSSETIQMLVDDGGSATCSKTPVKSENPDAFNFIGWNTDKTATTGVITYENITSDIVLYAIFSQRPSIIWYADEANEGRFANNEVSCIKYLTPQDINVPQSCSYGLPINDQGWLFNGWKCNDNTVVIDNDNYTVKTDHACEIWPIWIEKIKVTFIVSTNNGVWSDGTNAPYEIEVHTGDTVTCDKAVASTTPNRYDFIGWNEESDATTGVMSFTAGTNDMTMYAIFKERESITWIAGDETDGGHFNVEPDSENYRSYTQYIPATEQPVEYECDMDNPISSKGWVFNGWEVVEGEATIVGNKVKTNKSCTVRSKWIKVWKLRWIDAAE